MKLHSIELENFKSYSGKHTVGPFDDFSCIIGPNGSGKSNVMDAVCFVLSINSSFLRAATLVDLINSQSESATVVLVMKSDTEEILLRRTIQRNSISMYFINGIHTLQKQYVEFLEQNNIFPRSKNFLIFQGEIDSISLKEPKDFTKMVEEISGSVKYKQDYELRSLEMNKLFSESALIMEKKKDVGAKIKEIAESKDSKKRLKNKLKKKEELRMLLKLTDVHQTHNEIKLRRETLKTLYDKRDKVKGKIDKLDSKEDREGLFLLQNEVLIKEKELDEILIKKIEYEKVEAERDVLNHQITFEEKCVVELEEEMKERSKIKCGFEQEVEEIREAFETSLRGFEERNKFFKHDDSIMQEFNVFEEKYEHEGQPLKIEKNVLEKSINPTKREIGMCEEKINSCKKQIINFEDEKVCIEKVRRDISSKLNLNNANINLFKEKQKDGFEKYSKIVEDEKTLNQRLNKVMKDLIEMKHQQRESERKIRMNDSIEKLKGIFPGVYGRVVDLIDPIQKKYDLPLSVLIGGHESSVIVDNENTAIRCIEYMRERKVGRVTFLPLADLRLGRDENLDSSLRSSYLLAIDTISFDKQHFKAIYHILGNSLITSTVEEAKDVLYNKNIRTKICALNGVLFHKNGNITGGTYENKFTEKGFTKFLNEKNNIMDKLKEMKVYKNNFAHIEIATERVRELESENFILEKKLEEYLQKSIYIAERIKIITSNIGDINIQMSKLHKSIKKNQDRILKIENKLQSVENAVFSGFCYGSRIKEFKEFISNRKHFRIQKQTECDNLISNLKFKIDNINEELNSLKTKHFTKVNNLKGIRNKLNEPLISDEINRQLNEKQAKLKKFKKQLTEERNKHERLKGIIRENIQAISTHNDNILKNERDLAIKIDTLKELMREMILEEFEIPIFKNKHSKDNSFIEKENLENNKFNSNSLNEEAKNNKVCLNMRAIDEESVLENVKEIDFSCLKESKEHYTQELTKILKEIEECIPTTKIKESTTIQSQYDRLSCEYESIKSEAILARIKFTEVKNNRIKTFMDCYNKVNESLGNIYRTLTHDQDSTGNAYLLLENNSEPYLEGIKYYAMPPRKRYREMKSLSGGEKTMTALALLFAFHTFRPSPFYIFDEMDSALDKINVNRVIDYILKSDVQFIVITLKLALFQHADSLVGIYKRNNSSNILTYRFN